MKKLTPLKAIRAKCIDCVNGYVGEIRNCEMDYCALFSYRFGKNPNRKGIGVGGSKLNQETHAEHGENHKKVYSREVCQGG